MSTQPTASEGPITVIVTRIIKAGREEDFERWFHGINYDATHAEGYLGYNMIRPTDHDHPEYVIVFKFDTYNHLKAWEASPIRDEWLRKEVELDMTVGGRQYRKETGLEYWFRTPDDQPPARPAKYKMALITLLAIYPTLIVVINAHRPLTGNFHPYLSLLITATIAVSLMTYLIMPFLTRVFAFWLFNKQ